MAEVKVGSLHKVEIIESERGWGSKVDEVKYFDTKESAEAFIAEYNKDEDLSGEVPDWYMIARYCGRIA
jgi:hypothetical protein